MHHQLKAQLISSACPIGSATAIAASRMVQDGLFGVALHYKPSAGMFQVLPVKQSMFLTSLRSHPYVPLKHSCRVTKVQ